MSQLKPAIKSWEFVKRLRELLSDKDQSFGAASLSIGAAYSALAQYGSERFDRPTPEILQAMREHWPEQEVVDLLIHHLRDEIRRTGFSPERFTIAHYVNSIYKATDIQAIQRAADASPGWSDLLASLGVLARNDARHGYPTGKAMASEIAKVAEPATPNYPPPKKPRKTKGST